jgi:hypothetical protein
VTKGISVDVKGRKGGSEIEGRCDKSSFEKGKDESGGGK